MTVVPLPMIVLPLPHSPSLGQARALITPLCRRALGRPAPLPSRPHLPSLCINFSPPFEASLRSFLAATSPVAQPGPLLPGESRRTFGLSLYVNQHVIERCFRASLCPSNALLICSICLIHLDYRGRAQGPGRCQPSPYPDSIALNLGTSAAKRPPPAGERKPKGFSLPLTGEGRRRAKERVKG